MNKADCALSKEDIAQQILQEVSRSFALTIPNLPEDLCRIVTNAYLLCRIADTIEDEENMPVAQKQRFFREFLAVVNGREPADRFADHLYPLLCGGTLPAERELIRNAPMVVRTFFSFDVKTQDTVRRCLESMSAGMLKFQKLKNPRGLEDLGQMNQYCYHVAGIVGEMLTELFCDYSPAISRNRDQLRGLAASFGQGLQMTNILKDLYEDKERGACWLPQEVFLNSGFDLKDLAAGACAKGFGEGLTDLIAIAHVHLKDALAYTFLIPRREAGIRKFCLWAIGMAILTLQNINKVRNYRNGNEVKISRESVRKVILVSNATLRSNFLLKVFFDFASRGLPAAAASETGSAGLVENL